MHFQSVAAFLSDKSKNLEGDFTLDVEGLGIERGFLTGRDHHSQGYSVPSSDLDDQDPIDEEKLNLYFGPINNLLSMGLGTFSATIEGASNTRCLFLCLDVFSLGADVVGFQGTMSDLFFPRRNMTHLTRSSQRFQICQTQTNS